MSFTSSKLIFSVKPVFAEGVKESPENRENGLLGRNKKNIEADITMLADQIREKDRSPLSPDGPRRYGPLFAFRHTRPIILIMVKTMRMTPNSKSKLQVAAPHRIKKDIR